MSLRMSNAEYEAFVNRLAAVKIEWVPGGLGSDTGCLYVAEFAFGGIKVGRTIDWGRRKRELEHGYGTTITQESTSSEVSAIPPADSREFAPLVNAEAALCRYARSNSDSREFNPHLPSVGRDRTRPAGTEVFYGCDFDDLSEHAERLAKLFAAGAADGAARNRGRFETLNLGGIRQLIESVYDTCKGQLSLEAHGARTTAGLYARIAQRLLALAAVIWHNRNTGAPVARSLTAYDH
jgi:hypothetical protein